MNTMVLTRPTDRHRCLLRLPATPAAAAAARHRVRAALAAWRPPVDPDIAILLTSDLVTDALWRQAARAARIRRRAAAAAAGVAGSRRRHPCRSAGRVSTIVFIGFLGRRVGNSAELHDKCCCKLQRKTSVS